MHAIGRIRFVGNIVILDGTYMYSEQRQHIPCEQIVFVECNCRVSAGSNRGRTMFLLMGFRILEHQAMFWMWLGDMGTR